MAEIIQAPYKKPEFDAFIKSIKEGQIGHWVEIATALNVDQDTIVAWKKLPEAQEAIRQGIERALEQMQTSGAKDWRMWETKLKMLGLNPATKIESNLKDPIEALLEAYGIPKAIEDDRKDVESIQSSRQSTT